MTETTWSLETPRSTLASEIPALCEEARTLLSLRLDPALPAMKAIGVRELEMAIEGRIPLADAVRLAVVATRQYAKRQSTWFRHQLGPEWQRVETVTD